MEPHVHVEIVPRILPPTASEMAEASAAVEQARQSGNVRDVESAETDLHAVQQGRRDGYLARIGEAEVPIVGYALEVDPQSGAPMLSLALAPDSVSIGVQPPVNEPQPAAPRVASWGDGSHPDPREGIPGWEPERLASQVAGHAEQRMLRWQPSTRQAASPGFVRLLRAGFWSPLTQEAMA